MSFRKRGTKDQDNVDATNMKMDKTSSLKMSDLIINIQVSKLFKLRKKLTIEKQT